MTLNRTELRRLARETIAARHSGYRAALDALHGMQRQITPEMLLDLLDEQRSAAFALVEKELRAEFDQTEVTISRDTVTVYFVAHDELLIEADGSTLLAAVDEAKG